MERLTKMNETQIILTMATIREMKLSHQLKILTIQDEINDCESRLDDLQYNLDALRMNIKVNK